VAVGEKERERKLVKVDRETKLRIEDFFEGFELVEFLQLPVSEIIERFEDELEEALDEIEELMGITSGFSASPGERKAGEED
jgi:hypothetical protein